MKTEDEIKQFYAGHPDEILKKRFDSPYPIRRYAHRTQYDSIVRLVPEGSRVLDVGCGEGVISFLLAEKGFVSVGVDLSEPNIRVAREEAERRGFSHCTSFIQGDAEHIPLPDKSFDVVISSHVLEHLPDFDQGARELIRIARNRVIVALPTCLNLSAAAILGGDHGFWKIAKRSIVAFPYGIVRVLIHIFGEGVQEGYAGEKELPHIRRYPWVVRRRLEHATGWKIVRFEASSLVFPYVKSFLPIIRFLDKYKHLPLIRSLGYGSIAVLEPPVEEKL